MSLENSHPISGDQTDRRSLFFGKFRSTYERREFEEISKASKEELIVLRKKYEAAKREIQSEIFHDLLEEVLQREAQGFPEIKKKKVPRKKGREYVPQKKDTPSLSPTYNKLNSLSPSDALVFEGTTSMRGESILVDDTYLVKYTGNVDGYEYTGTLSFGKKLLAHGSSYSHIDRNIELIISQGIGNTLVVRCTESPRGLAEKKIKEYLIEERGYKVISGVYKKGDISIEISGDGKIHYQGIKTSRDEGARDVRLIANILARYKV